MIQSYQCTPPHSVSILTKLEGLLNTLKFSLTTTDLRRHPRYHSLRCFTSTHPAKSTISKIPSPKFSKFTITMRFPRLRCSLDGRGLGLRQEGRMREGGGFQQHLDPPSPPDLWTSTPGLLCPSISLLGDCTTTKNQPTLFQPASTEFNGAMAQSVERCGSQSEGPGFKSRRRRWDSSVGQTANGPCLSRLSCIYK